nr:TIM barrel protein [Pseudomonas subflava]
MSLLFCELPLLQRVQAAAAAGFDGVEVQFPYEVPASQLREELERAAMPLVLINLPAGDLMAGGCGLAAVPERQVQFDAALQEAFDYAVEVRPRCVNVLPGRLAEGVSRASALVTLETNLRRAAERFGELGVKVLCEAINPLDMPGFLVNTAEQLGELLERVGHPNCLAQLDFYHMARQGLDVGAGIAFLADRTGHVQFADCPGRGAPGTGALIFEPLLQRLAETGYRGWLGAEYRPSGATTDSLAWLSEWREEGRCKP